LVRGVTVDEVAADRLLRDALMWNFAVLGVNSWTLAEHAGESGPRGMQRFLSEAVWDHDGLLTDVQDWALGHEHEAHRALGDAACLMGAYDVEAEEKAIWLVLAGQPGPNLRSFIASTGDRHPTQCDGATGSRG
jgi:hypothetical protein